ncbi:hypothetical protein QRD02_03580 [Aequorivita sp. SDUM287046]|uniref:DUF4293 family protein n=1 Tax=Aequorivita aurantiaca TaxID=3053356 RepID=A0ABT8DDV6_9FLAO|nr:hypothetical protein [Aequorivita aurantiaca]MDN3723451.1 hypothetical protein [Aequorivita aurantiaca]
MNNHHNKFTKAKSSYLVTGSIIALIIAATPYLFYSYESFPQTKVWETFLFTYRANWYQEVYVSVWTMMGKFVPLLLLIIWFITCKHWWYHVILIPIGMFAFQLFSVINDDVGITDEVEIWWLFPIMLIIIPLVYLIKAKLSNRLLGNDLKSFEEELVTKKNFWQQIKDLF